VVRYRNDRPEILLLHREDRYFSGWHMCGSIVFPGRNAETTTAAILKREIGIESTRNESVFLETSDVHCERGQEVYRLFLIKLEDDEEVPENENKRFFSFDALPEGILDHHQVMVEYVRNYLAA
jgi:ADP-ribose pyrophosphatase YjhB (NUDIX family)